MAEDLRIERHSGPAVARYLPDVARLRLAVFREWPYLYDGDPAYEEAYLRTYTASPRSTVVVALDRGRVVGASTGVPLADETAEVQRPFLAAGIDPAPIFYCGESVLLGAYRGRRLGVRFFEEREAHARALGLGVSAFCGVDRWADDPRRPPDYVPLDAFWRRRGYEKHPELRTTISWKELGEAAESPKPMVFWVKRLAP
ncbi:MAG: GNAT family N-acetyltransferase [Deferrisomatales bacterium]